MTVEEAWANLRRVLDTNVVAINRGAVGAAADMLAAAVRFDEQRNELWSEEKLIVAARAFVDSPHIVEIGEHGWGLQHPPRCRASLIGCPVHEYMDSQEDPPAPIGHYLIDEHGNIAPYDGRPDPAIAFLAALEAIDTWARDSMGP